MKIHANHSPHQNKTKQNKTKQERKTKKSNKSYLSTNFQLFLQQGLAIQVQQIKGKYASINLYIVHMYTFSTSSHEFLQNTKIAQLLNTSLTPTPRMDNSALSTFESAQNSILLRQVKSKRDTPKGRNPREILIIFVKFLYFDNFNVFSQFICKLFQIN